MIWCTFGVHGCDILEIRGNDNILKGGVMKMISHGMYYIYVDVYNEIQYLDTDFKKVLAGGRW